jgi:p-aminobenzoyl-glutamate transporter AbgT
LTAAFVEDKVFIITSIKKSQTRVNSYRPGKLQFRKIDNPQFTSIRRIAEGVARIYLTPLFFAYAILLTTAQQYDKKAGMGTLFSAMLPYAAVFLCIYALQVVVWMIFDLPVGFGGVIWLR